MKLLTVEDLSISLTLSLPGGKIVNRQITRSVSFTLEPGQVLGVLGESGSGKTLIALTLTGLLGRGVNIQRGVVCFNGNKIDLVRSYHKLSTFRGRGIFLLPQSPAGALHPYRSVKSQLQEIGRNVDPKDLLRRVGVSENHAFKVPSRLSGGMQRRILLAMAIAIRPILLIADEPTEGLDPITKWEILRVFQDLMRSNNTAVLFITHDVESLAALEQLVGPDRFRVALFKQGIIDIRNSVRELKELMARNHGKLWFSLTGTEVQIKESKRYKLLELDSLEKTYPETSKVLNSISFSLEEGQNGGFIGRSGVGKTTLLKCIAGVEPFTKGKLKWQGKKFNPFPYRFKGKVQLLWQDPYVSLNPYMTAKEIIIELLVGSRKDVMHKLHRITEIVGLEEDSLHKYPWELSGGQCQRVALARALIKTPKLLLLDEPFTGLYPLDKHKLAQILRKFCLDEGITLLVASHNFTIIEALTDWVWVMEKGKIVEQGKPKEVFLNPVHPATASLVKAAQGFWSLFA